MYIYVIHTRDIYVIYTVSHTRQIHRKSSLYLPLGSVISVLKVMGTPDKISSPPGYVSHTRHIFVIYTRHVCYSYMMLHCIYMSVMYIYVIHTREIYVIYTRHVYVILLEANMMIIFCKRWWLICRCLQCVAVCCSVLQCVAVCCSVYMMTYASAHIKCVMYQSFALWWHSKRAKDWYIKCVMYQSFALLLCHHVCVMYETSIGIQIGIQIHTDIHTEVDRHTDTGWRRLIGCLKLQVMSCKRTTN